MAYPYIWAGPAWWRRVPEEASRKSARAVLVIFARGNGWRRKRWLTRQFRLENLCYPLCAHRLLLLAQASSLRKGNHHDSNFGGMGVVGCGPAHQSVNPPVTPRVHDLTHIKQPHYAMCLASYRLVCRATFRWRISSWGWS